MLDMLYYICHIFSLLEYLCYMIHCDPLFVNFCSAGVLWEDVPCDIKCYIKGYVLY